MGWWMPFACFAAMYCQDILGSVLVQAEASGRAHLAAACDAAGDVCGLASLGLIGGAVLSGNNLLLSAVVIAARLGADYAGTYTGVRLGGRLLRGRG